MLSVICSIELSLQLSDKEHLQKFKIFIGFEGKLITDSYRCRVSFKNNKIKLLFNIALIKF